MSQPILTNSNADIERDAYHDGYPALAEWMAHDPDNETLIFRRFDSLAALNILYLQAEVFEIRRKIINFQTCIVGRLDKDLIESMRRWETYTENVQNSSQQSEPQRPEQEMNALLLALRVKLKEYRGSITRKLLLKLTIADEALVLQANIAKLGRPRGRALRFFKRWFNGTSRDLGKKERCTIIAGEARFMLEDEDDLAAMKVPEEDDRLSQLLRDYWPLRVGAIGIQSVVVKTHIFRASPGTTRKTTQDTFVFGTSNKQSLS
jgi:hypothetical protein